jgi:uncharacterized pyridoxal phosphate-containing UPF0001 family protein
MTTPATTAEPPSLSERLQFVRAGIADAAAEAGRSVDELTTIVVTKFHPASLVRELYSLGVREVGENRHQEAQAKAAELADLDIGWNFIGQLQSKKARQVRAYAHAVHSLDRASVIEALGSTDGTIVDCFVQLNLTADPLRGGVRDADLEETARLVLATPGLRLLGVMAAATGLRPRSRRIGPDADAGTRGTLHFRRHVGRLPRGHPRGRDTPADWFRNHGKPADGRLI